MRALARETDDGLTYRSRGRARGARRRTSATATRGSARSAAAPGAASAPPPSRPDAPRRRARWCLRSPGSSSATSSTPLHLPEDGIGLGLGRRLAGRRRSSLTSRSAKLVSASWEWGHGKHCSGPRAYIGKGSAGGRSGAWGATAHWVGSGGLVVGRHV